MVDGVSIIWPMRVFAFSTRHRCLLRVRMAEGLQAYMKGAQLVICGPFVMLSSLMVSHQVGRSLMNICP